MLDRQFYPRLLASAPVETPVAARPVAGLFAERQSSSVLEPLVKELVTERRAVSDGDGPPPGGGGPRPRRGGADAPELETADEAALEKATTDLIAAADKATAVQAPEVATEDDQAAEAEPVAKPDDLDLTGYGVYGSAGAPAAVVGMSREELVARYAHLVKYVVGRLGVSVPGLFDHEDAMQAGVLGLLRAIDAYRPESAASFESYAILRIRGSILDAVRSLDTVGRAGREAARAIQGAIRDLQHELGRSPTESEIAARLGLPVARYRERLQAASVVTVSLDEHDSRDEDDDSAILADTAADPNAVDPAEEVARRDAIASLIAEIGRLSHRSRMVLSLYYQDEMTFKEIGQVLGVTESRVCQIHTEAILALRTRLVDPDVVARLGRRRVRS
jgi:RNA polymerase sigma factor for flagellar operon FliA